MATTLGDLKAGDVVTARGSLVFDAPMVVTRVIRFDAVSRVTVHFANGGLIPAQPMSAPVTLKADR